MDPYGVQGLPGVPQATPPATGDPPRPPMTPSSPTLDQAPRWSLADQNGGYSEISLLPTVLLMYICSTRFDIEGIEGGRGGSALAGGVARGTPDKP